jgi:hypothetical protein
MSILESMMADNKTEPLMSWKDFLEMHPPGSLVRVSEAHSKKVAPSGYMAPNLNSPDLLLHCDSDTCQGPRTFACLTKEKERFISSAGEHIFLDYQCRNCTSTLKTFAVLAMVGSSEGDAEVIKFGELPVFGPRIPARVIRLVQRDAELFNKGRRAENLGLGVGAYAYYRQVVENQKAHLIDEIIRVAKKLNADPDTVTQLERAKTQFQFTQSIEGFKLAIPETLMINGQNPLLLLHNALSRGLHSGTDAECLELAQDIRVVLTALAERISQALKDEAELNTAVSRLMTKKSS